MVLNADPFLTEDLKHILSSSPGYYAPEEMTKPDLSKISASTATGKNIVSWSKEKPKRELEFPLQSTATSTALGPGSYDPKKYSPGYKNKEKGSAFSSKDKKGLFGELLIGKLEKQKMAQNLQYIVDMQPGPGAYYSEKNSSSFHKKFDRLRLYQDFQLGDVRFKNKDKSNNLGPGYYSLKDDWICDQEKQNKNNGKTPAFNSSEKNRNIFMKVDKDIPGVNYVSKLENDPKVRKALNKKNYILAIKQRNLQDTNNQKEILHKPFRDKIQEERNKSPGPGDYNLEEIRKFGDKPDPVFRSLTDKAIAFKSVEKKKAPPPGYYLVENGTLASKLKKDKEYLDKAKLPKKMGFDKREPRFGHEVEKNIYKKLLELKESLSAEEKMAKIVRKLYKGNVIYTTSKDFYKPEKDGDEKGVLRYEKEVKPSFPFNRRVYLFNLIYFILEFKVSESEV